MSVSARIKEVRRSLGIGQEEFAKLIGLTKQSISNYETGIRKPGIDIVLNIATKFHISTDYMLGLDDDRNNIKRLHPEAKTALINWIEENFDQIEEYIFTALVKDGTTMTIYDITSYFNACAINNIQNDTIHTLARDDMLVLKGDKE